MATSSASTADILYDTFTNQYFLLALALGAISSYFFWTIVHIPPEKPSTAAPAAAATSTSTSKTASSPEDKKAEIASKISVMSAPAANLAPPKSDPISVAELAKFDGSKPGQPIYVAIKGNVYDVSAKTEMYGAGSGYNVFAGKDASRGLGMSSLDAKDAVADYSTLNEAQMKTLDGWETFFQKRYNVVGKVVN